MTTTLERQREERKKWIARYFGEPWQNVTLGPYSEPVEPNHLKCGAGRGEDCCIFLVMGADGFECARGGPLEQTLIQRQPDMTAKRIPISPPADEGTAVAIPYPDCMVFDEVQLGSGVMIGPDGNFMPVRR